MHTISLNVAKPNIWPDGYGKEEAIFDVYTHIVTVSDVSFCTILDL